MSQWKPDLGEFLYKHPQLKNSLLNQTIVLMNTKFVFKKETEGFGINERTMDLENGNRVRNYFFSAFSGG
jgi:hypothetical protein